MPLAHAPLTSEGRRLFPLIIDTGSARMRGAFKTSTHHELRFTAAPLNLGTKDRDENVSFSVFPVTVR